MAARALRAADFERALGCRPCARSEHFAVHHSPEGGARPDPGSLEAKLSTMDEQTCSHAVDDSVAAVTAAAGVGRLGVMIPKRHARRAVTRNLLKRQIRAAAVRAALPQGLWLVRLRAPFDRARFASAASEALRRAARAELDTLFARAQRSVGGAGAR